MKSVSFIIHLAKMSDAHNTSKGLQEHQVVPDVLPVGLDIPSNLKVQWPKTVLDSPGKELDREETQPEPKLYLDPSVSDLGQDESMSHLSMLAVG